MWLPWDIAAMLAAAGVVLLTATARRARAARRGGGWWAVGREVTIVLALYALWQWVHELAVTETAGAQRHATWVVHFERALRMPSELALQRWALPHPDLMRFLNGYYAIVHVPAMGALLLWAFFVHRDRYPWVRNTLALTTAGCLVLQTVPVAPPRFRPDLGFVDTGLLFGQSVYGRGGSGVSNQLAAMPSVHVAWAVLVGLGAVVLGRSRWRWLVLAHPVLTVVSVVATANHWWLDGIVSIVILGLAVGLQAAVAVLGPRRLLAGRRADPWPDLAGAGGDGGSGAGVDPVHHRVDSLVE